MATNPLFSGVNSNRQFYMNGPCYKQSDSQNVVSIAGRPRHDVSGGVYYRGKQAVNSRTIDTTRKENLNYLSCAMDNAPGKRNVRTSGTNEPPDKRRKTSEVCEEDDELWDEDDDFILTQDQLSNIDQLVASSQQVTAPKSFAHPSTSGQNKAQNAPLPVQHFLTKDSRSIGKGSTKSLSTNDIQTRFVSTTGMVKAAPFKPTPSVSKNVGESFQPQCSQQLTPKAATTANMRESPSLPSSHGKSDFSSISHQQYAKIRTDNEALMLEIRKLKETQVSKIGQIKILQDNLNAEKAARNKLVQDRIKEMDDAAKQQSEKEKKLGKEVEILKSKLLFQGQETLELQATCKRLLNPTNPSNDVNSSQVRSPKSSRHRSEVDSPKTPKPGTSDFPNTESFLQRSPVRRKCSPKKVKVQLNDHGTQMSPMDVTTEVKANIHPPKRKFLLKTGQSLSSNDGSNMVSKLLDSLSAKTDSHGQLKSSLSKGITKLLGPVLVGDTGSFMISHTDKTEMVQSVSSSSSARSSKSRHSSLHTSTSSVLSSLEGSLNIVSAEHHLLAVQGMQSLLQPPPAADGLESHDNTEAATLLLPLVEDYISFYINYLKRMVRSPEQASSSDTSLDTMASSMRSLHLEGRSLVALETQVEEALQILYTLVCHSGHVRDTLLRDSELGSPSRIDSEPSGPMSQPGEPSTSKSKVPATSTPVPDPGEPDKSGLVKTKFLLKNIIHIANPLVSYKMDVTVNVQICVLSMGVLSEVCRASDPNLINKLQGTNVSTCLFHCLDTLPSEPQLRFSMASAVIDVVSALTRSLHMIPRLCNESEDCLLLTVYSFYSTAPGVPYPQKTILHNKLLLLISSMLSAHTHGVSSVLEADCQCSVEMVKYVVQALYEELSEYRRNCGGKNNWQDQDTERASRAEACFAVLCKGTSLLYSLSLQDVMFASHHRFVEHLYIQLISGLDKLFKANPGLLAEECEATTWLWDFEQEWPDTKMDSSVLDTVVDNNNGKHHSLD